MTQHTIFNNRIAAHKLYRQEAIGIQGGYQGFKNIPDGTETVHYSVSINMDELDYMAVQAARNKSGICRDGALTVKITGRAKA